MIYELNEIETSIDWFGIFYIVKGSVGKSVSERKKGGERLRTFLSGDGARNAQLLLS